jgi:uncharacterized membrane protein YeaQ/YmgE (transglycosylase-associated protein family)
MEIIVSLLSGAVAGWLAGKLFKGSGFGLIGDIILGLVGGVLSNWLAGKLGISIGNSWVTAILSATVGALIILFIFNLINKRK